MENNDKLDLISAFRSGYARVDELIEGIEHDELHFFPPIRDAWSINDFLVHFLDADISLAFRLRTAIAEPGKTVPVWEEEAWHDILQYDDEDGLSCLALAKGIRSYLSICLRSVINADWHEMSIMHPLKGRLGLVELIEMYEQHIVFHLPLIRRNRRAWSEHRT
jgi:hypothetical protein